MKNRRYTEDHQQDQREPRKATDAEFKRANDSVLRRFARAFEGLAAFDRGDLKLEDLRR